MSFIINELQASAVSIPVREIVRYMGMRSADMSEELYQRIEKLLPRFLSEIRCRACWLETSVNITGDTIDIELSSIKSAHLAKNLEDCTSAILFAATIGSAADRLCRSASVQAPSNALIFDAMGSAAIEWFCDEICERLQKQYPEYELKTRFSPGYGDLSLSFQSDMIRILDTKRKIGLTLSESLMMLPQKSVTAIIGLQPCRELHDKDEM